MVFGILTIHGLSNLTFIDGNLNADEYLIILSNVLLETIRRYDIQDPIFQQDNAPCHTAKKVDEWFDDNFIRKMIWPPQSPVMNPIEHVWAHMKRQLKGQTFKTLEELKDRLMDIWDNRSLKYIKTLINGMPNRINALIDANGLHTRY